MTIEQSKKMYKFIFRKLKIDKLNPGVNNQNIKIYAH